MAACWNPVAWTGNKRVPAFLLNLPCTLSSKHICKCVSFPLWTSGSTYFETHEEVEMYELNVHWLYSISSSTSVRDFRSYKIDHKDYDF
jgi:hypothetical protein